MLMLLLGNELVCNAYKWVIATLREKCLTFPCILPRRASSHNYNIVIHIIFALHIAHFRLSQYACIFQSSPESLCPTGLSVFLHSNPTFPFMWGLAPLGWPQASLQEISKINICILFEPVSKSICGAQARVLLKGPEPLMTLTSCV